MDTDQSNWNLIIESKTHWWDLRLNDVWNYRDLVWLFVRRDFVSTYKQTILGPLWFFIQPLLTTLLFTIVFSGIAQISTDGFPPVLFYLAGMTPWNFFAACLTSTSSVFISNANLFGKVYFPRLVVPLSVVLSNLIQFSIQLLLFASVYAYYFCSGADLKPNFLGLILLTPFLLLLWMKMDVQGYESQVLDGLGPVPSSVVAIELELSLVPLYDGQQLLQHFLYRLENQGFRLVAIEDVFWNNESQETLQVNGVFLR
jgi:hypothetical protein